MKRYTEYSREELANLDDAGIQKLIDIEIAHAGIVPVSKPKPPTIEHEGITKKEQAFDVGGLLFKHEEDAVKVAQMELFKSDYDYSTGGYDHKYLTPLVDVSIERKMFYRQEDLVGIKEALRNNEARRKAYSELETKYNSFISETNEMTQAVWGAVNCARQFQKEVSDAMATYEKYLDLANGDEKVAVQFFVNTYKEYDELVAAAIGKDLLTAHLVKEEMLVEAPANE